MSGMRKQKFIDQQDFEIMRKKKWPTGGQKKLAAILDFISAKFVMGYPYVRHYILFYIHGPAILHFFELRKYHKIIKIQNGHSTAFIKLFAPKN